MVKQKDTQAKPFVVGAVFVLLFALLCRFPTIIIYAFNWFDGFLFYGGSLSVNLVLEFLSSVFSLSALISIYVASFVTIAVLMFLKKPKMAFIPLASLVLVSACWTLMDSSWYFREIVDTLLNALSLTGRDLLSLITYSLYCVLNLLEFIAVSLLLLTCLDLRGKASKPRFSWGFTVSIILMAIYIIVDLTGNLLPELINFDYFITQNIDSLLRIFITIGAFFIRNVFAVIAFVMIGSWIRKHVKQIYTDKNIGLAEEESNDEITEEEVEEEC